MVIIIIIIIKKEPWECSKIRTHIWTKYRNIKNVVIKKKLKKEYKKCESVTGI